MTSSSRSKYVLLIISIVLSIGFFIASFFNYKQIQNYFGDKVSFEEYWLSGDNTHISAAEIDNIYSGRFLNFKFEQNKYWIEYEDNKGTSQEYRIIELPNYALADEVRITYKKLIVGTYETSIDKFKDFLEMSDSYKGYTVNVIISEQISQGERIKYIKDFNLTI